jgi:DNA-binding NarL/FixJ family response regulator
MLSGDQQMNARPGGEAGVVRVMLADGRPGVRSALRLLLEQVGGMTVSSEATTAGELLEQVSLSCPDVILLDCDLAGPRASEFLLQLRSACPRVQVIALCSRPETRRAALSAGADAFVCKTEPPETVVDAIRHCFGLRASKPPAESPGRTFAALGSPPGGCQESNGGVGEEGQRWNTQAQSQ